MRDRSNIIAADVSHQIAILPPKVTFHPDIWRQIQEQIQEEVARQLKEQNNGKQD